MEAKIRFLGLLSVRYGSDPIPIHIDPSYEALQSKILELIDNQVVNSLVILRNGRSLLNADPMEDGDEFQVFMPISGG
jgi:molybdopterin converting factor small subunit